MISPNIFNLDLWVQSGHAQHYKDNMFTFTVEEQEWGNKTLLPYQVKQSIVSRHEADELSGPLPHVRSPSPLVPRAASPHW